MAIIRVLPHSFDDVIRTISVLDKFDKQSVIQLLRNIDQTRSNLSGTLLPFLLHQHLPDCTLSCATSPSTLHPLLPPLTLPPVLQAAPFASFAPLLVMLRPNASLSSISCILTLHCHFTVCIEQDTMYFIRDNKIAFQAKTGASNSAFLSGDTIPVGEFASLSSATTLPLDWDLWHRRLCHHHLAGIRKLQSGNLVTGLSLIHKQTLIQYVKPAKLERCMQIPSLLRPPGPQNPSNSSTVMCMALSGCPHIRGIATVSPSLMTSLTSKQFTS